MRSAIPNLPLADATTRASWPDGVDSTAIVIFLLVAFGLPALGYVFMALDFRRYLRSLRRALVIVMSAAVRHAPSWASSDSPPCMQALDLTLPCTEEQVLAAYRRRVKDMHPDRGGDLRQFLQLQKHFEQAMHLARSQAKIRTVSVK